MSESDDASTYPSADLDLDLRWWAAANYLTIGQIYLRDNALLREPLVLDHVKPRLLGHWGTSPGLSMLYALLNRVIRERDGDWLYVTGPGHGGPALVAAAWLEGTYTEVYPHVADDADGIRTLFRQFSSPGGVPSHVSVQTPGSIHEGGELGYALAHAAGRGVRPPRPRRRLRRRRRRGRDRTAGRVVAAAHLPQPPPRRGGAADPPPQRLQDRRPDGARPDERRGRGGVPAQPGLGPRDRRRRRPAARSSRRCWPPCAPPTTRSGRSRPRRARGDGPSAPGAAPVAGHRPAHPEGLDRPCRRRRHPGRGHEPQPPGPAVRPGREPRAPAACSRSGCGPTTRHPSSTPTAASPPSCGRWPPRATAGCPRRPTPTAGGCARSCRCPRSTAYEVEVDAPGVAMVENTVTAGRLMRDLYAATTRPDGGGSFRLFCPDETASNRLQAVFEETDRCFMGPILDTDTGIGPDGRVMEVLSEHLCEGWLEGYLLTGRHGVFATYEAFAMVSASMAIQHVKWLQHAQTLPWRASVSSLNVLLTSTCWRNDHNGFSHQGPGPHRQPHPARPGRRAGLAAPGRQHHPVDHRPLPAQHRPRQPHRRRQAEAPAVPHPRGGPPPLRPGRRHLGVGEHGRWRGRPPTSSSRAPATCRRRRPWPRPSCSTSTCPTCASASSTSST